MQCPRHGAMLPQGLRVRALAGLAAIVASALGGGLRGSSHGCLVKWGCADGAGARLQEWTAGPVAGQSAVPSLPGVAGRSTRRGLHPAERFAILALFVATVSASAQLTLDVSFSGKATKGRRQQQLGTPRSLAEKGRDHARVVSRLPGTAMATPAPEAQAHAACLAAWATELGLASGDLGDDSVASGAASRVPGETALAGSLRNGHLAATFSRVELLAAGTFGVVCRALHRLEGVWYAIKMVPIRGLSAHEDLGARHELREVRSLRALTDSRNVVRYHTAWCEEPCCLQDALLAVGRTDSHVDLANELGRPIPVLATSSGNLVGSLDPSLHDLSGANAMAKVAGETTVATRSSHLLLPWQLQEQEQTHTIVLLMQMELCDGMTLCKWLDSARGRAVPQLSGSDAGTARVRLELQFAEHLLKACREIHRAGLVHGDLKPSNVFVMQDKVLKVGDFGLARRASESCCEARSVARGITVYCAPEGASHATAASDIFSAAVIILELLCPPIWGSVTSGAALAALRERCELPHHIEEGLPGHAELLRRMASPRPEDRPTAAEAYATLKKLRSCDMAF
mmetsp:Transcript_75249/g.243308  ORF Transcript_75249/g.243308 Transcript_75249/m.243308 type:complete len:572 (-) Transcript_75249:295-2010(-)